MDYVSFNGIADCRRQVLMDADKSREPSSKTTGALISYFPCSLLAMCGISVTTLAAVHYYPLHFFVAVFNGYLYNATCASR